MLGFGLSLKLRAVLVVLVLPAVAGEGSPEILAGNAVANALVGPLAGEVGREEVRSVAVEPVLVLLGGIGERPDGDAMALSLGDVLDVALEDVLIGLGLLLQALRAWCGTSRRDIELGDS